MTVNTVNHTRWGERIALAQSVNQDQLELLLIKPQAQMPEGELANIRQAAKVLGIAPSTIHRWINDGFIAAEQITPGAPWQIRITEELRARFVEQAPEGYVPMQDATKILGVSRQTVLQRVKRGELDAVHIYRGKRKGLRIKVVDEHPDLFHHAS